MGCLLRKIFNNADKNLNFPLKFKVNWIKDRPKIDLGFNWYHMLSLIYKVTQLRELKQDLLSFTFFFSLTKLKLYWHWILITAASITQLTLLMYTGIVYILSVFYFGPGDVNLILLVLWVGAKVRDGLRGSWVGTGDCCNEIIYWLLTTW